MEHEKEKLNRFISAVNSVTDKQVESILSEAEEEKKSILSAAAAAARETTKRHLSDNLKMMSNKYIRMLSKAELEMKKEVLVCREKLTDELFGKVTRKLSDFTASDKYAGWLTEAICAESDLEGARICLAPADMKYEDQIKQAVGADVSVAADDSIKYGGFYILRTDRGTITDRSFDCALKEQQALFASRNLITSQEVSGK